MEGTWETSVLLAAQLVGMSIVAQLWLRLCAPGILKVNKKTQRRCAGHFGQLRNDFQYSGASWARTSAIKLCAMKFGRPNYRHSVAGHLGHIVVRPGASFSLDGSLASV